MSKNLLSILVSFLAWFGGGVVHCQAQAAGAATNADTALSRQAIEAKGISSGFRGESKSQVDATLAELNKLGVAWLRMDFDWSEMQPEGPGRYHTVKIDQQVEAIVAHGIKVLGIIDYTPAWANGHAPSQFYPPKKTRDYTAFAAYLARRYAPMGVHTWEIWNEPNGGEFWMPKADPKAYARLLKAAYPAIKKADPQATVITGGLAPACDCKNSLTPMTFLDGVYKAGAKRYFDHVGHHPYTYPHLANATDGGAKWWTQMYTGPQNLRSIMTANGDADKKIWMTEYGAPTNGGSDDVTEAVQAEMLKVAYQFHSGYSWAGPLFWYTYQDSGTDLKNEEDWYGLIRADGTHKPAYGVYDGVSR